MAPRRLKMIGVLATFVGALAACNLIAGLGDDFTVGSDAATDDKDVVTATDGQAEGSPPVDGGLDVIVDAPPDVPPTEPFCVREMADAAYEYCDDFEANTNSPLWGWDAYQTTFGTTTVEAAVGTYGSKGLHSVITKPDGASGQAYLRKQLTDSFTSFNHYTMSFAVVVRQKTTIGTSTLGVLSFTTGTPNTYVGLGMYAATPDLLDICDPPGKGGPSAAAVVNQWNRVTISLDRSADSGPYTAKIFVAEGAGTANKVEELQFPVDAAGAPKPQVLVGAFFTSANGIDGIIDVVIDDVIVRRSQ